MCCGATDTFDLPAEVIEALARYEQLRTKRPFDWGDDRIEFFRWGQFLRLQSVFELFVESGDLVAAVRTALRQEVPAGVVFVRVDGPDRELIAKCGPPVIAFAGQPVTIDVIVDVEPTTTQRFEVDPDHPSFTFAYDGRTVDVDVEIRTVPSGEPRLTSPRCARWSV